MYIVNLLKNKDTNLRYRAVSFHCRYLCSFKTRGTYEVWYLGKNKNARNSEASVL